MKIIRIRSELDDVTGAWRTGGASIGFVPTMGALHEGHLSLVKLALEKADFCVVSIFVNPTQFAPHEDFATYPREEESDLEKLKAAGAHCVYLPSAEEMYPGGPVSDVKAGEAAKGLESIFRPHFFAGVASVVSRLFDHAQPDLAVFGEKDFQQLQVITEMVAAQGRKIEIIGAPIVRDEYGLALSSRNAYLSEAELEVARGFNKVLFEAVKTRDTETAAVKLIEVGFDSVDYVAERWGRILGAARIGKTRLIDNVGM